MSPRTVAIFIFDDVEILDFTGPYEVFAVSRDGDGQHLFNVVTVSKDGQQVTARNGLKVMPDYSFASMPSAAITLIPGGNGTRPLLHDEQVIAWIQQQYQQVELLLSVCTGALLLGKAGLLNGLSATTYHTTFDLLAELSPNTQLCPGKRWVENERIITSAGVSAGIDMALHVVRRLHGTQQSERTAQYMEYEYWSADRMP